MKKYVIDCKTGVAKSQPMTPAEAEAKQDNDALWELNAPQREREGIVGSLKDSDYRLARATEDLIVALVRKGAITLTELPVDAVKLLAERKSLRLKLT